MSLIKATFINLPFQRFISTSIKKPKKSKDQIRKDKINLFISRLAPLLKVILYSYLSKEKEFINRSVETFVKKVSDLNSERGIEMTILYVKTSRNIVMRYISGQPLLVSKDVPISISQEGIPSWLEVLVKEAMNDSSDTSFSKIRIIMTLLTSLRSITCKPSLKVESIIKPFNGYDDISTKEIARVTRALKIKRIPLPDWDRYHMTTKRGPLGQAILTSMSEVTVLPYQLIYDIFRLGGESLASEIESLKDRLDILQGSSICELWASIYKLKPVGGLRKLSYFSDKEGKTRVIGILDYWTQSACRPLHKYLNNILRRIPTDMTFNQSRFSELDFGQKGEHSFHSIDLSSATDRMPIILQKRIIGFLIGEEKADAWSRLLTSYPFHCKVDKTTSSMFVYGCGQPMGAYSSWPAMALTHHYLVRIAAMRCGLGPHFDSYFLLGDDLVIYHDLVAESYKVLISNLDMPYSVEKTHTSKDVFEFAKRWYYKGVEISGFSIGGLLSTYQRYPLLHNFLTNQATHGWAIPIELQPGLIRGIFSVMKHPYYIINKVESSIRLYTLFHYLMEYKHHKSSDACKNFRNFLNSEMGTGHISYQAITSDLIWFRNLLSIAKYKLVESDLYKFQTDAYKVNATLNDIVKNYIQSLGDQPEAQVHFLTETISTTLNWNNPIVKTLNRLIDKSIDYLTGTVLSGPGELVPEFIIEQGLSKYFVSKGVFSARASVSIALAESAVLKKMINEHKLSLDNEVLEKFSYTDDDSESEVAMAGFIPPFWFITRHLGKIFKMSRIILIRRSKWVAGYSVLLSLISLMQGSSAVINTAYTIWNCLQSLFVINTNIEWLDFIFPILCNITFHLFDLFIALGILVTIIHFSSLQECFTILYNRYIEGVITFDAAAIGCLETYLRFLNQFMAQTWTTAIDCVGALPQNSILTNVTIGFVTAGLVYSFVR